MNPVTTSAWIGLGSNLDDPRHQLDRALQALAREPDITLQQVSSYYRTAPWGVTDQPHFVNAVARPSKVTGENYNKVSNAFWNASHSVLSGGATADAALAKLDRDLKRIRRSGW